MEVVAPAKLENKLLDVVKAPVVVLAVLVLKLYGSPIHRARRQATNSHPRGEAAATVAVQLIPALLISSQSCFCVIRLQLLPGFGLSATPLEFTSDGLFEKFRAQTHGSKQTSGHWLHHVESESGVNFGRWQLRSAWGRQLLARSYGRTRLVVELAEGKWQPLQNVEAQILPVSESLAKMAAHLDVGLKSSVDRLFHLLLIVSVLCLVHEQRPRWQKLRQYLLGSSGESN